MQLPLLFLCKKGLGMRDNIKVILITVMLFSSIFTAACGCYGMPSSLTPLPSSSSTRKETTSSAESKEIKKSIASDKINYGYRNGDSYLRKYQNDNTVRHLVLVEQTKNEISSGTLTLLSKNTANDWEEKLHCIAYLGANGLEKKQEGDKRTPSGDYGFLMAFGAKNNPGSVIPYTKLTDSMYLCGDKEYYNQFIDISKIQHKCSSNSEHLIRYIPQYNYALILDYNKENVYGKGSAIFLHCFGSYQYTLGCISIAEENMIKILKTVDTTTRICIYAYQEPTT